MRFFIDVSDKRNLVVKQTLGSLGYIVKVYDEKTLDYKNTDVLVFSPAKKFLPLEVESLPNDITLFAGASIEKYKDVIKRKNIKYINIMDDEIFTIKNANLTAEGVLALILEKSERSIFKNKVLLLGSGRITKACAMLFAKLGVKYAIASYTFEDYQKCYSFCDECYLKEEWANALNEFDIVVNTRPFKFIDENIINKFAKNTILIETASVDCLDSSLVKNFTFVHAPALPMRYASQTAGEYMTERILKEIEWCLKI